MFRANTQAILSASILTLGLAQACNLPTGQLNTNPPVVVTPLPDVVTPPAPLVEFKRCFTFNPQETLDAVDAALPAEWVVKANPIMRNGRIDEEIVVARAETDFMAHATLCIPAAHLDTPLLITATHAVMPLEFSRIWLPPQTATTGNGFTQVTTPAIPKIDLLSTNLGETMLDVFRLPFMASITVLPSTIVDEIEAVLRKDRYVVTGLKDGDLTVHQTHHAINDNINNLPELGRGLACLSSPFPTGKLSTGAFYTFPGGAAEAFPMGNDTTLNPDGSLATLFGQPIESMEVTVNDVDLNDLFTSKKIGNKKSGAFMQATDFDDGMDAEFSLVNLHNNYDTEVLTTCVAGFLTIDSKGGDTQVNQGSGICIDVVDGADLFTIPSNDEDDDGIPDDDTQYIVFGDESSGDAWVLGAPGIRAGKLRDYASIEIDGEKVCVRFNDDYVFDNDDDNEKASLFTFLCTVPDGFETFAAARAYSGGRGFFEVGSKPAFFGDEDLNLKTLAGNIGRSDIMLNPFVIDFMESDVRDSLVNYFRGEQANVFFAGKGFEVNYDVILEGTSEVLARIFTGPQGQWSGAIPLNSDAKGKKLRFVEHDKFLQDGHFFELTIAESCMPPNQ